MAKSIASEENKKSSSKKSGEKEKTSSRKNSKSKKESESNDSPSEEIIEVKTPPTIEPIVVETPKEEEFDEMEIPSVLASTPAEKEESHPIDVMAKTLNKVIHSHVRGITRKIFDDYLKTLPRSAPFYIIPKYEKTSFTVEITDGNKKVVIPAEGSYALLG